MSSRTNTEVWALKLTNVLTYVLFTSSNVYSGLSGHKMGGPITTYITPAPWFFGVWSLIHTLLFGLMVYQFWPSGHKAVTEHLGWRLPLLLFLNSLCSTFYSFDGSRFFSLGAFLVLLFVAGIVSHIYGILRLSSDTSSWPDILFVHLPMSLYHGFIVIIFFVAAFAVAGVDAHASKAGLVTKALVFMSLFFLESTAAGYVFYGNGDIAGAFVISLGLLAIACEQQSSRFIHWSAIIFFVISFLAVLRATVATIQSRRESWPVRTAADEESAPLVQ
ncbi:hypothetical protein MEQU1_003055 [Malassezia equina]|uniref:Membrane permease n=1 Tax=Malassezia equina TaxID=1381935 RepID=A0AAF0EGU2_9BASI|nr:hypothetical protein MEQU1_003055 [Malassezia equina]